MRKPLCTTRSISFGALIALLGCNASNTAPTTAEPSGVEASYQELAGEFAACGEQLDACLTQADSDRPALWSCRVDFGRCRAEAGKHALQAMSEAIHACVAAAKQCKHAGDDAGVHECRAELWSCLWHTRHAGHADNDSDAGTDEGDSPRGHDCITRLHKSAWAGRDAGRCARDVRECVASALPEPEDIVADSEQPGAAAAETASNGEASKPGTKPASKPAASAGSQRAARPRTCLQDFHVCLHDTRNPRACIEALRTCAHGR